MITSDFDYDLPPELIAQEPLPGRLQSRMLVLHRDSGDIEHAHIHDLPSCLSKGDLLVVNDTRVIPARVFAGWQDTGGRVELLIVEEKEDGTWEALLRASRKQRLGKTLVLAEGQLIGVVEDVMTEGRTRIRFSGPCSLPEILQKEGMPPVPPYIKRPADKPSLVRLDRDRYQTVYARKPGAVAAPTAGLHFTCRLFSDLEARGIRRTAVTLHVGPGTFRPVKAEQLSEHVMEAERYEVSRAAAEAVNTARASDARIVAVGSTAVRTLETVASADGRVAARAGRTSLCIHPPYAFKVVDVMLTNFHLPRSTLLMMVCALAGTGREDEAGRDMVLSAYREAVREKYRFYSYGDCMLVL
jgi:S-adenosylmethionine:tRNA ribosyltransferase-isomerase